MASERLLLSKLDLLLVQVCLFAILDNQKRMVHRMDRLHSRARRREPCKPFDL